MYEFFFRYTNTKITSAHPCREQLLPASPQPPLACKPRRAPTPCLGAHIQQPERFSLCFGRIPLTRGLPRPVRKQRRLWHSVPDSVLPHLRCVFLSPPPVSSEPCP
jgi:hypothetical protein